MLANEFRPKTLKELVGQSKIKSIVAKLLKKPPHAWLFAGPPGTGKTTLARIVANSIGGKIIEINAAQSKEYDQVKSLLESIKYKPPGVKKLVVILDEAHELNASARNALLKPVEEPPSWLYWIFCTTEPQLLATPLRSRCIELTLQLLSATELVQVLKRIVRVKRIPHVQESLNHIAEAAGGVARRAITLLESLQELLGEPDEVKAYLENYTPTTQALSILQDHFTRTEGAVPFLKHRPVTDWKALEQELKSQLVDYFVDPTNKRWEKVQYSTRAFYLLHYLVSLPEQDSRAKIIYALTASLSVR